MTPRPATGRNEPLGMLEVSELLDVSPLTVQKWKQRELLPDAEWEVSGRPAWKRSTIVRWAKQTGRWDR